MRTLHRWLIGLGFIIAALLGIACTAIIVGVVIEAIRGTQPMGKDFIAVPLFAALSFLLLKAARDLWVRLRETE